MSKLLIKRKIDFSGFGTSVWLDKDYETPLVFHVDGAKVSFYLEKDTSGIVSRLKINVMPKGRVEILYDPAPSNIVKGLKSKTSQLGAANTIYSVYKKAFEKLEAILISKGNQKFLFLMSVMSEGEFYRERGFYGDSVEWSIDSAKFVKFEPKLPKNRKRNPMFKSDQLITHAKWKKFQESADNKDYPSDELLELYRIRNKSYMQDSKTAAIEASIISETLLREYGLKALKSQGFSNNKIKRIKDELTFNNLLNVILPLSLSKSEFSKISSSVTKVDNLRKVRNDFVHGNKSSSEFESSEVAEGTEAAIRLVNFLKKKIEEND
ncbi:MAG: hypothetical protein PF630_07825 [Gammaproteobacteria bacterium]|jgi:hypothetical protein|nr:hypothetical protein [Gammaproteobacteria bacterium]